MRQERELRKPLRVHSLGGEWARETLQRGVSRTRCPRPGGEKKNKKKKKKTVHMSGEERHPALPAWASAHPLAEQNSPAEDSVPAQKGKAGRFRCIGAEEPAHILPFQHWRSLRGGRPAPIGLRCCNPYKVQACIPLSIRTPTVQVRIRIHFRHLFIAYRYLGRYLDGYLVG
ncbi:hypothetical protein LX36DRAFT_243148 [Colletotrichum falcatum]|nr:hypothetical protein LX36DRAFT_243148 [Colletotrichum falcatum]